MLMPILRLVPPNQPVAPEDVFAGDDHALVAGIRRGEAAAASALYLRYQGLVRRTLVRMLGFDSELADAIQETFVRALGSTRLLRDPQALPSWILRIAVCTAGDIIRKRRRRRWLQFFAEPRQLADESELVCPENEVDWGARAALRATQAILDKLPVDERLAFTLRRFEGLELTEVAEACGCSLATIKRRLVRAEARFLNEARQHPELDRWLEERGGEA